MMELSEKLRDNFDEMVVYKDLKKFPVSKNISVIIKSDKFYFVQ